MRQAQKNQPKQQETRFNSKKNRKIPGQDFYNLLVEGGFIAPEKAEHTQELRKKVVDPKDLSDELKAMGGKPKNVRASRPWHIPRAPKSTHDSTDSESN